MIYVFTDIARFDDASCEALLPLLPPSRRGRALRYHHAIDRRLCVASWVLFAYALYDELGWSNAPIPSYGPWGKPAIAGICFNISHCRRGIVCALSDSEIGCDMQQIDADAFADLELAKMVLTGHELEAVRTCAQPLHAMAKLWAAKESLGKRDGRGLPAALDTDVSGLLSCDILHFGTFDVRCQWVADACVAVCGNGAVMREAPLIVPYADLVGYASK